MGDVRLGSQTSDPKDRYCASFGHKQDDESGLIYMRARYYEPGSGRFVSEDPSMAGLNYFAYCSNKPGEKIDVTGKAEIPAMGALYDILCRQFHWDPSPSLRSFLKGVDSISEHAGLAYIVGVSATLFAGLLAAALAAPVVSLLLVVIIAAALIACVVALTYIIKDGVEEAWENGKGVTGGSSARSNAKRTPVPIESGQ